MIVFNLFGIVILFKELQDLNASLPISITLLGISIVSKDSQPLKAHSSIQLKLAGNTKFWGVICYVFKKL